MPNVIDSSQWPLVHYIMPERVNDEDAAEHIAVLNAILTRCQPFVLIFSGVEQPKDSPRFLQLLREWSIATRQEQQRWCLGAVRVEPDEAKRRSLWRKALRFVQSKAAPYPYKVVASAHEAHQQADAWLAERREHEGNRA